jgi:hypothetical protein
MAESQRSLEQHRKIITAGGSYLKPHIMGNDGHKISSIIFGKQLWNYYGTTGTRPNMNRTQALMTI